MTTLTFTPDGHGSLRGADEHGTELFSIHISTLRDEQCVTVRASLPGMPSATRIDARDGGSKYSAELRDEAIQWCESALERWAVRHLGVTVSVDSVVNPR